MLFLPHLLVFATTLYFFVVFHLLYVRPLQEDESEIRMMFRENRDRDDAFEQLLDNVALSISYTWMLVWHTMPFFLSLWDIRLGLVLLLLMAVHEARLARLEEEAGWLAVSGIFFFQVLLYWPIWIVLF